MMKKILFCCVVFAFFSCSNAQPETVGENIFLEQQVKDFIAAHPDWSTDETTKSATTDKFKHQVINWSNEPNFLENMPLQLKAIIDTSINEQSLKIAKFNAYNDKTRIDGSLLNVLQLEILGIVSPTQIKDLTVGKNYTLSGTLYKQGKRAAIQFIEVADFKGYHLGKYTFAITAFKNIP